MKKKVVHLTDLVLLEMLMQHLSDVPNPSLDRKKKHPLMGVLGCILCGMLGGCNGLTDIEMFCIEREEWLQTLLEAVLKPKI